MGCVDTVQGKDWGTVNAILLFPLVWFWNSLLGIVYTLVFNFFRRRKSFKNFFSFLRLWLNTHTKKNMRSSLFTHMSVYSSVRYFSAQFCRAASVSDSRQPCRNWELSQWEWKCSLPGECISQALPFSFPGAPPIPLHRTEDHLSGTLTPFIRRVPVAQWCLTKIHYSPCVFYRPLS